ncbi:hypothetical protein pipiens_020550, partial [Culex pipiens pipiens]
SAGGADRGRGGRTAVRQVLRGGLDDQADLPDTAHVDAAVGRLLDPQREHPEPRRAAGRHQ